MFVVPVDPLPNAAAQSTVQVKRQLQTVWYKKALRKMGGNNRNGFSSAGKQNEEMRHY